MQSRSAWKFCLVGNFKGVSLSATLSLICNSDLLESKTVNLIAKYDNLFSALSKNTAWEYLAFWSR